MCTHRAETLYTNRLGSCQITSCRWEIGTETPSPTVPPVCPPARHIHGLAPTAASFVLGRKGENFKDHRRFIAVVNSGRIGRFMYQSVTGNYFMFPH